MSTTIDCWTATSHTPTIPTLGDVGGDENDGRGARAIVDPTAASERAVSTLPDVVPKIGRYAVLRRLGEGGMGVVLCAYDETLNRRVAIKLLKGGAEEAVRARMLREGQAMARLSHPNVVPVFEVGEHRGGLFLAMELVEGKTLRDWKEQREPQWKDLLRAYLQAARGLEAAHQAGLLHRDFKPDNAIIGEDGRVRVLDFGLASANASDVTLRDDVSEEDMSGGDAFSDRLTLTGATLGTPAYMAPEQFVGDPADERTDVFAFCVSLFEALYDRRPFEGRTRYELAYAICEGRHIEPPTDTSVPPWLQRAVLQGLRPSLEDRPQSMRALLDVIDIDLDRGRKRAWLAAALVGVGGLAAAAGFAGGSGEAPPGPCEDLSARLEGVWDAPRRDAVEAAFTEGGVEWQAAAFHDVAEALDEHGETIVDELESSCRATHVSGEQSEQVLDLRTACLLGRTRATAALTEVFTKADATTIMRAREAVADLPDPLLCRDTRLLSAGAAMPTDAAQVERIEDVRDELARIDAWVSTGHPRSAQARIEGALTLSRAIDYGPLVAEAQLARGSVLTVLGDFRGAQDAFSESVDLAEAHRHDEVSARAWVELYYLATEAAPDAERLEEWGRRAIAAVRRIGDPDRIRSKLALRLGLRAIDRGDFDAATSLLAEIRERAQGGVSKDSSYLQQRLALAKGEPERVLEIQRAKLAVCEAEYGLKHPNVGHAAHELGVTLTTLGRVDEARQQLQRALKIRRSALGDDHPEVGRTWLAVGSVALSVGKLDEAANAMRAAARAIDRSVGPQHPAAAEARINLGIIAFFAGDNRKAADETKRALEILDGAYAEERPEMANAAANLGEYLLYLGELEEAKGYLQRASVGMARTLGDAHPDRALPLKLLGFVHLLEGDAKAAVPLLRHSVELVAPGRPFERADALAALAVALWPDDPAAARSIAKRPGAVATEGPAAQRREALIDLLSVRCETFAQLDLTGKETCRSRQKQTK